MPKGVFSPDVFAPDAFDAGALGGLGVESVALPFRVLSLRLALANDLAVLLAGSGAADPEGGPVLQEVTLDELDLEGVAEPLLLEAGPGALRPTLTLATANRLSLVLRGDY